MADKQSAPASSTFQSYVDSAVATGQSLLGSLSSNQANEGKPATSTSTSTSEISKIGPVATSPSTGGIATDSPLRTEGSYNQTVGSAKEALGGLVGAESLKREGQRQNAEGKGMEAEGQVRDLGQGLKDRYGGAVSGAVKGLVGDREGEAVERLRHDDGKAAQRSAEKDIVEKN